MKDLSLIIMGCNSFSVWEEKGFFNRSGHLVRELAQSPAVRRILYFYINESPVYLRNIAPFYQRRRVLDKITYTEFSPLLGISSVLPDLLKKQAVLSVLKRQIGKGDRPVYLYFNPLGESYAGAFGERLSVFDAFDDWNAVPFEQLH